MSNVELPEEKEHQCDVLSPRIIQHLQTTSKWTRFIGGFSLVLSILYLVLVLLGIPNTIILYQTSQVPAYIIIMQLITPVIIATISIYSCYLIFDYGRKTSQFVKTNNYVLLGKSFEQQLKYWRFVTILACLILLISFILIISF